MHQKRIPPEVKFILLVAKEIVGNAKAGGIKDLINAQPIDWQRFKELIAYHELTPFAYIGLKKHNVNFPGHLNEFLKQSRYRCLIHSQYLWQEFIEIADVFEKARITLLPIKGLSLLEDIYSKQPFRPMVDIDILVKEEDLATADRLLQNAGYNKELSGLKEEYWRQKQCHITFRKRESKASALVDVHWALDFKRNRKKILPHLWERIREVQIRDKKIELLSPEDTIFSLALHSRRFGKMLCLKYICDIGLILNRYGANFDWDYLLKEARQGKMRTTIFFALSQMKLLLDAAIPQAIWKELRTPFWKRSLIHRFIEKDTFSATGNFSFNNLYLKSHFLLYDSFWEPIEYILNIPQEQFAKYYDLEYYNKKTEFFYKNRLFYILFKTILDLICQAKIRRRKRERERRGNVFGEAIQKCKQSGDVLFFETMGFSMWPFLRAERKLIVRKCPPEILGVGDIILYKANNQTVCHRLIRKIKRGESYLLYVRGDNSTSSAELVSEKMFLGRATAIIKNGKIISLDGIKQRAVNLVVVQVAPLVSRVNRMIRPWYSTLKGLLNL